MHDITYVDRVRRKRHHARNTVIKYACVTLCTLRLITSAKEVMFYHALQANQRSFSNHIHLPGQCVSIQYNLI